MWNAEILIEAKRDLPSNLTAELANRVSNNTDHQSVLKNTIHKDSDFLGSSIVCSFRDQHVVYFMTKSDARTLTVHVERLNKKESVRELKNSVLQVIHRIEVFLKHCKNAIKKVEGDILNHFDRELTCTRRTFWTRLIQSLQSNILSKLYVPVATVVASLIMDVELNRAIFNALTALVALTIWLVIDATIAERYSFCEV